MVGQIVSHYKIVEKLARAKGDFSVSETGILVYGAKAQTDKSELIWMDRQGRQTPIVQTNPAQTAALSPNARKIAFDELEMDQNNVDIWIYDIERGSKTRFTFHSDFDMFPFWTPDGSAIIFSSSRERNYAAYLKHSDGTKEEQRIIKKENNSVYASDISTDSRFVLVTEQSPTFNLGFVDLKGDSSFIPIVSTSFNEGGGNFSPDGPWVLYSSDESSRNEIYVVPFKRPAYRGHCSASEESQAFN